MSDQPKPSTTPDAMLAYLLEPPVGENPLIVKPKCVHPSIDFVGFSRDGKGIMVEVVCCKCLVTSNYPIESFDIMWPEDE